MSIRAFLRSQQARKLYCGPGYSRLNRPVWCSHRAVERRVKELYITLDDVQTQRVNFFNIRLGRVLKTWYTFRKFNNRRGRWIKEPLRKRFAGPLRREVGILTMRRILMAHGGMMRARRVLFAFVFVLASGASAWGDGIRPQDEIVLVNVRPAGGCCDAGALASSTQFETYAATDDSGCRHWQSTSLESVVSGDASVSTVIFVHGNRLTNWDAKCEGVAAYRRIVRNADAAPIRFVIFSWPSAQISGPLKDVRVKAARTRPAGCQLAWFVDQLPAKTPLTMVGFSYGARIITGSLHILAGGSLGGMCIGELRHPNRRPVNTVLLASALNSDWLCPGHYHGQAMPMVHQMVLVNNREDRAMKYYHFSSTCGRPQALGYCGPTCIDPAAASKIVELNVGCYVGSEHDLFCYLAAPGVISEIDGFIGAGGAVVAAAY